MANNYIEVKLYKGTITLRFFPETHIYMKSGIRCSSPTGAIGIIDKSKQLVPWAGEMIENFLMNNVGKKLTEELIEQAIEQPGLVKREAANIGTAAHEWIEKFVKGEKPPMPEKDGSILAVSNFLNWVKEHKIKFISAEKLVYSKKYNYAGTVDAIATVTGEKKPYIIDYKVSNGLYPSVALQTAAYQFADAEESGTEFAGRWVIRLSKETEEEYNIRQEKKLARYMKKSGGKTYDITPYKAFEARLMTNYERDVKVFKQALDLSLGYREIDREFFNQR